MGLFGGNDENDEILSRRGGFDEKDTVDAPKGATARVIDEEAEIVLYSVSTINGVGVAAVPLEDTALELPGDSLSSEK